MSSILGKRLKKLREERGYLQKFVADKLGIRSNTLSGYENGSRSPDPEMLVGIADLYNVTTDYLLGKSDSPDLTAKDEKDIAKKLENIINSMESDTALSFDGEPMDEETKELVRAAIESNLILTKQLAKKKFTPKKYRKE